MKAIIKDAVILIVLVSTMVAVTVYVVHHTPKRFSKEHLQSLGFNVK